MLTGSLLLAVAQASGLYPASTAPLKGINRSPRFGNERPLYSYEADYDIVASARSLGESKYNLNTNVTCEQLYVLQIVGLL